MEGITGGYRHSSIILDVVLNVNQKPAADLINAIVANAATPTTIEMQKYLTVENRVWIPPKVIVQQLNLDLQRWIALSQRQYSIEAQRANQTPLYEVLLLYLIRYSPEIKVDSIVPTLLIGDFTEIAKPLEVIVSPDFQQQYMEWKGFAPDPYKPNQMNLSEIFPLYDRYVNQKWLVGLDGTGSTTDTNLQWLKVSLAPNQILLGAESRLNYFDDSQSALRKYYRLCLGVLANCQLHSTAAVKITLPTNNGIYGIYSLFALFFAQTRVVKTRHVSPDDSTAYLIGIGAQPISLEILKLLLDDQQMLKVLAILASNTNRSLDNDLNRLLKDPTEIYIDQTLKA